MNHLGKNSVSFIANFKDWLSGEKDGIFAHLIKKHNSKCGYVVLILAENLKGD